MARRLHNHDLCEYARFPGLERRPGNALNVELGTPQVRCTLRPPDGRGVTRDGSTLDYLRSGGSILAYGMCDANGVWPCPRANGEDTDTRTGTDTHGRARTEDTGHGQPDTGHSPSPTDHGQPATGHSPSPTGHGQPATGHSLSPDAGRLACRCPECGHECGNLTGLGLHCDDRPACRARVRELLAAADMGMRICPRCDCAILGAVALADGVWIHQGCLTTEEREARGIEDEIHAAMAYAMGRAGAMPRPSKPAEVLP